MTTTARPRAARGQDLGSAPHAWAAGLLALGAVVGLLAGTALVAGRAESQRAVELAPARHESLRELVADVGLGADLDGGMRLARMRVDRTEVTYELERSGRLVGRLHLRPKRDAAAGEVTTTSFAVRREVIEPDDRGSQVLVAATTSVAARDDGGFYVTTALSWRELAAWGAGSLVAALAWMALVSAWLARRVPGVVAVDLKSTHLLPAGVQLVVFAYWWLYWPGFGAFAPLMLPQLAFAYLVDGALSLAVRKRLVFGLALVPVVGSTNLFVQFGLSQLYLPLGAILVAVASKALLWREVGGVRRHVFNPSGLGLTVMALVQLSAGIDGGDGAARFGLPPNMTELVLLLVLAAQLRRPVVLVSLVAFVTIDVFHAATRLHYFDPLWPPVFLALTLLATDPATMPETGVGRVLFGALVGLGFMVGALLLDLACGWDFYGKVLVIPLVNLLAPACDRAGARLRQSYRAVFDERHNRAHVFVWVAIVVAGLYDAKPGLFAPLELAREGTPLVARGPGGEVTCARNPIFCRPFSFVREVDAWAAGAQAR